MMGVMGMRRIRVGIQGNKVEMQGIKVGIQGIRAGMRGIMVGLRGIRVWMQGIRVRIWRIKVGMRRTRVEIRCPGSGERKMGYFPWLVSCKLIRLNPGVGRGKEKNFLCSDWEGECVQGQSWTVVAGFN